MAKCKLCEKREVGITFWGVQNKANVLLEENNLNFYGDGAVKYTLKCSFCPECGKELKAVKNKPESCVYCTDGKPRDRNITNPIVTKKNGENYRFHMCYKNSLLLNDDKRNRTYSLNIKYCPICGRKLH